MFGAWNDLLFAIAWDEYNELQAFQTDNIIVWRENRTSLSIKPDVLLRHCCTLQLFDV